MNSLEVSTPCGKLDLEFDWVIQSFYSHGWLFLIDYLEIHVPIRFVLAISSYTRRDDLLCLAFMFIVSKKNCFFCHLEPF